MAILDRFRGQSQQQSDPIARLSAVAEIPIDERPLVALEHADLKPFRRLIENGLGGIMPAHVIYPAVDDKPAGFSAIWLKQILRRQLGFNGMIFSDDLSMEGARRIDGQVVSYTQAGVAALKAGCDLVLLCNQSMASAPGAGKAVDELLDGLAKSLLKGLWQANEASERRRRALLPTSPALGWAELMVDARYLQALDYLP